MSFWALPGWPVFKDWGSGQPIVFSHGWPLSSDDWDAQMLFFLHHGYRVIAHDRRGHGRSAQPSTCTTPSTSGTPRVAARWHATSAATASRAWRR
jgi:pimeloyl-ACP methyl ester carboxylesterase